MTSRSSAATGDTLSRLPQRFYRKRNDQPPARKMTGKRTLLILHRRIAVLAALFLLVQAVSGIAISWRWEIARFLDPAGMTGSASARPKDTEAVLREAAPHLPEASGLRIFFPVDERGVYLLQLETAQGVRYVSVDPADGRVMRQGSVWRFPVEAALMLHYRPVKGWAGSLYVLSLGLVLTAMIITGFLFWRPDNSRWLSRLAVDRRRPAKVFLRQCHRSLGIIVMPLLLTTAITGSILAAEILVGSSGGKEPDRHYVPAVFNGLDRAIGEARQAFPESAVRDVRVSDRGEVIVQLWNPGEDPWAINRVTTRLHARGIVETLPASQQDALWATLLPIHTGTALGTTGRLLAVATAVTLIVLAAIGLYLWLVMNRRRRD